MLFAIDFIVIDSELAASHTHLCVTLATWRVHDDIIVFFY